jgi:hypothetical protein
MDLTQAIMASLHEEKAEDFFRLVRPLCISLGELCVAGDRARADSQLAALRLPGEAAIDTGYLTDEKWARDVCFNVLFRKWIDVRWGG